MRCRSTTPALVTALVALACAKAYQPASLLTPSDPRFTAAAPDSFDVAFYTTKGMMLVRARRAWAPHGVDRFYGLARNKYFDSVGFHRTISGFVAQFGIHGDTAVSRAWRTATIPDDTTRVTNQRGTLSFARGGANSRSIQLFFNLVNNPRLDTLNAFGFPPIAQVIDGIQVLDSLNWEYSGKQGQPPPASPPQQAQIQQQGNAYLRKNYPRLDYIDSARVLRAWRKKP